MIRRFYKSACDHINMGITRISFMGYPTLILSCVFLIALFALFRADFNYIDDLGRVQEGYRRWNNWSRYVSHYGSALLHMGRVITDISPIPQMFAIVFMAGACVLAVYVFSQEKHISVSRGAASIPLALSPWFLECFSYKFDSPYMALSVLASVAPFCFWDKNLKKFFAASVFGLLIMDMTYQAASGIFILEVMFLSFLNWTRGKSIKGICIQLGYSVGSYVLAMVMFRFVFMKKLVDYVSTQMASPLMLPVTIYQNGVKYLTFVFSDMSRLWMVFFGLIIISFIAASVWKSKRNRLITFVLAGILVLAGAVLSYGCYLALEKPLFSPRAMLGFGAYMAFLAISLTVLIPNNILVKGQVMALGWCFLVFTATYGNVLAEQKRYTDFRVQLVIEDVSHIASAAGKKKQIQLEGDIGRSPVIAKTAEKFPAIKRLIPATFAGGGWYWSYVYFYKYFNMNAVRWDPKKGDMRKMDFPVVYNTDYHKIQSDGEHILVTLK